MFKKVHEVVISETPGQAYTHLVHCNTCGWEGRAQSKIEAVGMKAAHVGVRKIINQ